MGQPTGPFEIFGSHPALLFWSHRTADFPPCVSCPSLSALCSTQSRLFNSLERRCHWHEEQQWVAGVAWEGQRQAEKPWSGWLLLHTLF